MRSKLMFWILLLIALIGLGYWFNKPKISNNPVTKTTQLQEARSIDPSNEFRTYISPEFGGSFKYPANWKGPEVYVNEDGFRAEVGTDNVYPYGTDITEKVATRENNYFVIIQYYKKPLEMPLEDYQVNSYTLNEFDKLKDMPEGSSIEETKRVITKIRNIEKGSIKGIEYLTTLPFNAQTSYIYLRETILVNADGDSIIVRGSPDNVAISSKETWEEPYKQIDEQNLDAYRKIVDSASF